MKSLLVLFLIFIVSCGKMPTPTEVKSLHPSSFLVVKDEKGEVIHETRINYKKHRREWITLEEMGSGLLDDIIRFEDKRFWDHPGVDPIALLGAVRDFPKRGGSTISMQLAKLLSGKKERRSWTGKLLQLNNAILIEKSWTKKEILEAYLNLASFRGELEGIMAGSLGIYNKDPRALSTEERTVLLAMIPAPSQKEEALFSRACAYSGKKYCGHLREIIHTAYTTPPRTTLRSEIAPHVAEKFRKSETVIQTSLRKDLQTKATELLKNHVTLLKKQNVSDGAVMVVERKTGKILAYVGSSGELSSSPHVDHVQSLRQAGSTLKPLLYAQAISKKLITMATPLKDEPFTITREGLTYQPENYQKSFTMKDVPAKIALGSSLNIPAIRVIDFVTPASFHSLLSELGMRRLENADFYGHSMALGSVDVTLWDLVRAYNTMANAGEFRELSLVNSHPISGNIKTLSPDVSWIVSQILSEKDNRSLTFGIQSTLATDSWSAVKTGTSKDMRDNWCVGYTDTYVIGVWVGNSSGDSMWNVTGISGAAPLFSQLVSYLHQNKPSLAPEKPASVVEKDGNFYLAGTEPISESLAITKMEIKKILFPQEGAQFAYDPEIPRSRQRILFTSTLPHAIWKINGKALTTQEKALGFLPEKKGKYHLELWDTKLIDEVSFFVKAGKSNPVR